MGRRLAVAPNRIGARLDDARPCYGWTVAAAAAAARFYMAYLPRRDNPMFTNLRFLINADCS